MVKVAKISDNLYQLDNNEIPIDNDSLKGILKESSSIEEASINNWLDELDDKGENSFKISQSGKGTVVNIYEVDYPQPEDPNKETQEMMKYLDEYEDAISQQLFPGVPVDDVLVTTQKDEKEGQGRFFTEQELREKAKNVKRGWKERLRDNLTLSNPPGYEEARKRAKAIVELIKQSPLVEYVTDTSEYADPNNRVLLSISKTVKGYKISGLTLFWKKPDPNEENDEEDYDKVLDKWFSSAKVKALSEELKASIENLLDTNGFEDCLVINRNISDLDIYVPYISQKQSSWREVLGETITKPSPVKIPTKPPEKPIEKPKINPFRKPEHIRPSKEPQPKALPVTYPQGAKLKIHPELENQINSKDTPYHALPQLPGGEFIENIASDRFKIILRNLERYSGKPIRSLRDIAMDLMDVIQKIDQVESQHISELEDLAVSLVEQHFGIDPREVGFDAKLVRNVNIGDITNISPEEEKSIEESLPTLDVDLEVSKRTFINGLIQGAGINSLNMFHLVSDELNTIDPNLINMYGLLTAFAELGYWVTPSLVGLALSGGPVGGKVKLDFSQNEPKIVAVAINFPILVQELVKGVMELLSSHGLPEDESVRDQVLQKADSLESESWDIRFGPEIWKKLLFHINTTELNGRALSILYHNLVQLDAATFSDFVYKILSNDSESINKWNEMYNEALDQSKTASLKVSDIQDEESIELYNQYRKEMLSKGKTPELYFEWVKDGYR